VGSATGLGVVNQFPLALHARKPAPEKQHQTRRTPRRQEETASEQSMTKARIKGKRKRIPNHDGQGRNNRARHHTFSSTLRSRIGPPAASLTTPLQAPALRYETGTTHDFASKKVERRLSLVREPERNIERSSFSTKSGRGLRNTRNTCFLNATIPCLGAIDEVNQIYISTKKSTTTQDRLLVCFKELQGKGRAYTHAPLKQQIPNLIRYNKGEPADANEFLIARINDVSEPISQLFQGQMVSTVKCSSCDRSMTKTDNTQDIPTHQGRREFVT